MPYVDKEKQRKAQREYKRRKQQVIGPKLSLITLSDAQSLFGGKKVITWKELTKRTQKISTYTECVENAKKCLVSQKTNRYLIALMCQRACVIKHGNHSPGDATIAAFAKEIGIHPKTLNNWLDTKKKIIDMLSPDIKQIEWRAAELAKRYQFAHPTTSLTPDQLYERHKAGSASRCSVGVFTNIKHCAYYLATHGVRGFNEEELSKLRQYLNECLKVINHEG